VIAGELLLGLRWVLAVVFLTGGAAKLGVDQSFEQTIAAYGLVPGFLRRPLARSLPALEISVGAACGLGILPALACWAAAVLLSGFACAVCWSLARGRRFDCGCGIVPTKAIGWDLVLCDLALAMIAAAVAVGPSGSLAVWRGSATLPSHPLPSSTLIPIPMTVILTTLLIRSLVAHRPSRTEPQLGNSLGAAANAELSVVHHDGGISKTAQPG
jgi:uncharacterized membrane protein YphA (DoxX/SURF4 family)